MPLLKAGLCQALSQDVVNSLVSINLRNVSDFVAADLEDVSKRTTIPYKELVSIRRIVLAQFSAFPVNGCDLYDDVLNSVAILPTGCSSLDGLLDGGVYTGEVTEVMGGSATGKTQFCLGLSLSVAMEMERSVLYVDTNGSFDVSRLQEMLEARGTEEEMAERVCQKVRCHKVFDVFELLAVLEDVAALLTKQADPFTATLKLLIIDSIPSVILPILGGNQTHGQGLLQHLGRALRWLAVEFSIAVLVTNNIVVSGAQSRPSLGKVWCSVPSVRVELERYGEGAGGATLRHSTRQASGSSVSFTVTDQGLR